MGKRAGKPARHGYPALADAPRADVAAGPAVDPTGGSVGSDANPDAGPKTQPSLTVIDGGELPQRRDFGGLDRALAGITPTYPLTYQDAAVIFDILRPFAPAPLVRDVMHDHREIIVRIFNDKTKIYEARLKAVKAR